MIQFETIVNIYLYKESVEFKLNYKIDRVTFDRAKRVVSIK